MLLLLFCFILYIYAYPTTNSEKSFSMGVLSDDFTVDLARYVANKMHIDLMYWICHLPETTQEKREIN